MKIVGKIEDVEIIAVWWANQRHEAPTPAICRRAIGRNAKGVIAVYLAGGSVHKVQLHSHETHSTGKKKIKGFLS